MSTTDDLRLAIIGTGRPWKTEGATGFGMAHSHIKAYKAAGGTRLVALADIRPENATKFKAEHGDESAAVYHDYRQMLAEQKPDVVSICTWPHLHAEMTVACAEAGVKAVHCEKPTGLTFGEAKRMVAACEEHGTQLTFNHQRRFNKPFRTARQLLRDGRIGKLLRIETACGNLYDWGTHWFDMMLFYNDQTPAEWVIAQYETRGTSYIFGAPGEGQAISHIRFANGVHGLMVTGYQAEWEASHRLVGTEGVIEYAPKDKETFGTVRVWGKGQTFWEKADDASGDDMQFGLTGAVTDLLDALRNKREPELSGKRALQTTELIFASYESSRRQGRVDLPLDIDDSPLLDRLGKQSLATFK